MTRRLIATGLVALSLLTTSLMGCGGGETVTTAPEPGSADDSLKSAPAPERPAPEKNVPEPSKK